MAFGEFGNAKGAGVSASFCDLDGCSVEFLCVFRKPEFDFFIACSKGNDVSLEDIIEYMGERSEIVKADKGGTGEYFLEKGGLCRGHAAADDYFFIRPVFLDGADVTEYFVLCFSLDGAGIVNEKVCVFVCLNEFMTLLEEKSRDDGSVVFVCAASPGFEKNISHSFGESVWFLWVTKSKMKKRKKRKQAYLFRFFTTKKITTSATTTSKATSHVSDFFCVAAAAASLAACSSVVVVVSAAFCCAKIAKVENPSVSATKYSLVSSPFAWEVGNTFHAPSR